MSDPLKKDEIEDVLSSIRRLVSEDVRTMAEPEAVAPAEKPVQEAADKLVLTPSLRVEEEAKTPEASGLSMEELVAQEMAKATSEPEQGPRVLTLSKTGADTAAPTQGATISAEALRGGTPEPAAEVVEPEPEVVEDAPEAASEVAPEPEVTAEAVEEAQVMPAVEWQSVRSYSEMEFEPEAAGDGDYAGTEVEALEWGQNADTSRTAPEAEVQPEQPASEAVIDAEVVSAPKQDDAPYEAVLDEEMLRDLVGEIVRQELQGPLGERITRNVRKLVRREINRALASRQMD
ncbi:MAG: hypothetical protein ACU0AU_12825 [Cognatishimia activa]